MDASQWADPLWRLSNLYSIVTDEGKEVRFKPNEEQVSFYKELHNRNIICKARQLGFTTFLAIIALDQCLFVSNYTACIIAHTLPDAKKIFRNKIKRVYDALPAAIRDLCPLNKEAAEELVFDNGSSISVATSSRGGTTQFLHVSEMGKISRVYPERAKEIVTGAFESVPADGIIVVESTAEGQDGWFYEACMLAERKRVERQELTRLDFKLHFYPWQNKSAYRMSKEEAARVYLTDKDRQYFADLQSKHGITLTQEQKAWWVKKRDTLMENMGREYPSTLEESFAVALEGAIYQRQMTMLRNANRIGVCPVRAGVAVDSYWDFGVDDSTTIWLRQRVGGLHRFVRYFEASGEGLTYYWELLERWREEKGVRFNRNYIPHDGEQRIQGYEVTTRKAMLLELGMRNIVTVPRVARVQIGIDAVRAILPECEFDAEDCAQGIKCLDYYSREWDESRGTWSSTPKHDKWSHGADGFRQFAQSLKLDAQDMPISTGVYLGGY